jgi:hypothetical protein
MVETARRLGVPEPISIQNDFSLGFRHFEEVCVLLNYKQVVCEVTPTHFNTPCICADGSLSKPVKSLHKRG